VVILISVIQHPADARSDDSGDTPRCEQEAIVDTSVARAPEIGSRSAVHGKLRSVTPVDDENCGVQVGSVATAPMPIIHKPCGILDLSARRSRLMVLDLLVYGLVDFLHGQEWSGLGLNKTAARNRKRKGRRTDVVR